MNRKLKNSYKGAGGHANVGELSLLGAINPDMVDIDKFGVTEQDRKTGLKHENKEKIDFEAAEKLLEIRANAMAEAVQKIFNEMNKTNQ